MKIVKEYLNNEFVFDNIESKSSEFMIDIKGEIIQIDCSAIIDTQFSGGNVVQEFEIIKSFLNLGIHSKAPCGGFINFYLKKGSIGNEYVIFSGIKEVSNSHYIITIHKILKRL